MTDRQQPPSTGRTADVQKKSGRGGRRPGAGRKPKWGGRTVVIRVPEDMVAELQEYIQARVEGRVVRFDDLAEKPKGVPAEKSPDVPVGGDALPVGAAPARPSPAKPRRASRRKAPAQPQQEQLTLFDLGF